MTGLKAIPAGATAPSAPGAPGVPRAERDRPTDPGPRRAAGAPSSWRDKVPMRATVWVLSGIYTLVAPRLNVPVEIQMCVLALAGGFLGVETVRPSLRGVLGTLGALAGKSPAPGQAPE